MFRKIVLAADELNFTRELGERVIEGDLATYSVCED